MACNSRERVENASTPPSPPGTPNNLVVTTLIAHATARGYDRGACIIEADDADGSLYLVGEGHLRLIWISAAGDETTLTVLHPGSLYYLARNTAHTWLRILAEGTVVYRLGNAQMRSLARAHPALAIALIDLLGHHLAEAHERIEDLVHCSTKVRLAHILGRLARTDQHGVVHFTHRELADILGTTREEITKALRTLRAGGYIPACTSRRCIIVSDSTRLLALQGKSG